MPYYNYEGKLEVDLARIDLLGGKFVYVLVTSEIDKKAITTPAGKLMTFTSKKKADEYAKAHNMLIGSLTRFYIFGGRASSSDY